MAEFKTTTCHNCRGEGFTMERPGLDYIVREKVKLRCAACNGMGEYLFLPPKLRVIVDKDVECSLTVWKDGGEK